MRFVWMGPGVVPDGILFHSDEQARVDFDEVGVAQEP